MAEISYSWECVPAPAGSPEQPLGSVSAYVHDTLGKWVSVPSTLLFRSVSPLC